LIAVILATLVAVEGVLRFWAYVSPEFAGRLKQFDLLAVQIEPMGQFAYRQRPNAVFHYRNGTVATSNRLGYRGPLVALPKPRGAVRVILVGGSATHGYGVNDGDTIDAHMRRLFATHSSSFEVVNLACDGYDSYQNYERIRSDGLRFEPDLIILNSGINDVRNSRFTDLEDPDPRTLLWRTVIESLREQEARGRPTLRTVLKHHIYLWCFASLVRWSFRTGPVEEPSAKPTEPNWGVLDYFERNLRRTAALAAERSAALLLSTEPSGIPSNCPADAVSPRDYWIGNAGVTQEVRNRLAAVTRSVAAKLHQQGQRIASVSLDLAPGMFMDDAHLTPAGNQAVAANFVAATLAILGTRAGSDVPNTPR
jgi:lysophospholipase L1-like esterase